MPAVEQSQLYTEVRGLLDQFGEPSREDPETKVIRGRHFWGPTVSGGVLELSYTPQKPDEISAVSYQGAVIFYSPITPETWDDGYLGQSTTRDIFRAALDDVRITGETNRKARNDPPITVS